MFDFHWPWMALLFPLPLLVRWLWPRQVANMEERPVETSQTTLLHPSFSRLQLSFGSGKPRKQLGGRLHILLLSLCWASLVTALMRPQWLVPETQVNSRGYDLMLAVDTSRSMTALDFTRDGQPVSRMSVVKGVMDRFIAARSGDRVGLVIFGTLAYIQSPLTLDLGAIRQILGEITPGMAGDATAMGDAMGLAIKKLRLRPEGSRVLLLITDGDNTSGVIPPLQAASLAAREGIRIYTIGVGSDQQEVPMLGSDGRYHLESDAGMKEDILIQISRQTGGAYFRATNTLALEEISRRINELEKTQIERSSILVPHPLYRWPLGLGLLALLLIGLFPEGRMRTPGVVA
jgi:Ca-activated chloride channel family protein